MPDSRKDEIVRAQTFRRAHGYVNSAGMASDIDHLLGEVSRLAAENARLRAGIAKLCESNDDALLGTTSGLWRTRLLGLLESRKLSGDT